MHPSNCPDCGISWYSDYPMPNELATHYPGLTNQELEDMAAKYGWTKENDLRFSKNVRGIEYDKDIIEAWMCHNCGHMEERKQLW